MHTSEGMPIRLPARTRRVVVGLAIIAVTGLGCFAAVASASPSGNPPSTPTPTATPAATASAATQAATSATPADILDVTFDSGAPVDHAQGLPATTVGAPQIADDATLGTKVATFNGTSDAYYFPFADQWPKLLSGFSYECVFRYNPTSFQAGQQVVCSDANGGGAT